MFDRIDPRSPTPLYEQIASRLRVAIASGELSTGAGLPSVRQLAAQLRINPATVVQAYRELEAEGFVKTRHGAGTFVSNLEPHKRIQERSEEARRLVRDMIAAASRLGLTSDDLAAAMKAELDGAPRMSNAIETRDLSYRASKSFEIRDLALNVPTGALYGFLGPNGSGKTTTIRLMLGLLRKESGAISVLGASMPDQGPRVLAKTGYVPERPHIYPTLTVAESMRYHAAFYRTWDWKWANELAHTFMLRQDQKVQGLSKGETGKLMMLLALAQKPELLVLDEPTDGLDPVVRRDVLMAVLDYVSQVNATVFISSHLIHELERICDWVGVMDRGRLIAELPMQSFKNGIKRLRVANAPAMIGDPPFVLLSRESMDGSGEQWLVRGWQAPMRQYFDGIGATLREVIDLDLEEGFVELLRSFRSPAPRD